MIQITPHMRIFVAREPIDLRNGIDGTASICRRVLAQDPMSGAVFVFRNRPGTMVRVLVYDGQGFWLMTKRLSQGKFPAWHLDGEQDHLMLQAHELQVLLAGGNWSQAHGVASWRSIAA